MENMERFRPLYAITYIMPILNGMENVHFDKEGYFHVLVFYVLFYKRNRKHESLGELEITPKLPLRRSCFYNCMQETEKMFSIS